MAENACAYVGCSAKPLFHAVRITNCQMSGEQHFCEEHVQWCSVYQEFEDGKHAVHDSVLPEEVPYGICYLLFDDRYDGVDYFNAIYLKHLGGSHLIGLQCGLYETSAIYYESQKPTDIRLTHSLMKETIQALGGSVDSAVITDVSASKHFRAVIRITTTSNACSFEVDARPSDALALALTGRADILVKKCVVKALCMP